MNANNMKELKNTAVHLQTQVEYEKYIQMCEDAGWKWYDGTAPKIGNVWDVYKGKTCVLVKNSFNYANLEDLIGETYLSLGYYQTRDTLLNLGQRKSVLTLDELKALNNIKTNNFMTNLITKLKQLTLAEPNKTFVKAGLMNVNGNWTDEVKDTARALMLEEYMKAKDFQDKMLSIAKVEE